MTLRTTFVTILLATTLFAGPAMAAGFAIIEQGVKGLGNAYAGAAGAEDATTIFYNPAGMIRLSGQQAVAGLHYVVPTAKFKATKAENVLGTSLGSDQGGEAAEPGFIPNAYFAVNFDNRWALGFGINAPFALTTDYGKGWVGRYHAVESAVEMVNINPSVAYRVNDKLSLGAGVSLQHIEVTLSNMVDFGLLAAPGVLDSNPDADVFAEVIADDWSFGYNLGLLYEHSADTRFGLAYRSQVKHELEGEADFAPQNPTFLAGIPAGAGTLFDVAQAQFPGQGARGDVDLPASASLSAYHRLSPRWAVMADVTWTEWSSFDELVINFDGTLAGSPSVTTENWDDNWRYALGATFTPSEKLALRLGLAFDETPIPDSHRTPRIPAADRFWTAFGAGYKFTDTVSCDVGYAHLFVDDGKMVKEAVGEDAGRGALQGEYENSVDIVSAQLNVNF